MNPLPLPVLNPPSPAAVPPVLADLTNRIKYTEEVKKRRRLDPSGATDNDVVQAVIEESKVASEISFQAMLAPILARFDMIDARFDMIDARFDALDITLARSTNASVTSGPDFLVPIRNAAGNLPAPFPATKDAFEALDMAGLDLLLNHYNLPLGVGAAGTLIAKKNRLKTHLHIRR